MQRVNSYWLYTLGTAVEALRERVIQGTKVADVQPNLFFASYWLEQLVNDTIVPLKLTRDAARSILNYIKPLAGAPADATFDWPTTFSVTSSIQTFQTVFAAESERLNLYYASAKRAWDMDKLIDNAEVVLSPLAQEMATSQSITDIREAGRSIAFGLPTAAGFHLFRLLETYVLLYFQVLNIGLPEEKSRNLGTYIKMIQEHGADAKVTAMLTHLKDTYRNPIMHPEITFSEEEAENLFGLTQSVIGAVAADINRLKQGTQLSMPITAS